MSTFYLPVVRTKAPALMPLGILVGRAIAVTVFAAPSPVQGAGPHDLGEILSAYSSATGNFGLACGRWGAANPCQTTALAIVMLPGRCAIIVPMLTTAALMIRKTPAAAGTFPTHGPLSFTALRAGSSDQPVRDSLPVRCGSCTGLMPRPSLARLTAPVAHKTH